LANRPALARLVTRLTGRKAGHWPRGIRRHDIRRGLPFGDGTVDALYASHTIEHLHRSEALALLRDAHRVLVPGGICRIVVPDLHAIVGWYLDHRAQGPPQSSGSSDMLMELLNVRPAAAEPRTLLGWYRRATEFDWHKWMYDADGLIALFHEAGFAAAAQRRFLESAIPQALLGEVEQADRVNDGGVCVEARRE
jgi:SAM-dependent methyltransferase